MKAFRDLSLIKINTQTFSSTERWLEKEEGETVIVSTARNDPSDIYSTPYVSQHLINYETFPHLVCMFFCFPDILFSFYRCVKKLIESCRGFFFPQDDQSFTLNPFFKTLLLMCFYFYAHCFLFHTFA